MYDAFRTHATAVSSEVFRFPTRAGALNFILDFLRKEGTADREQSYALWADCPFLKGMDKGHLSEEVPSLKFEVSRDLAASAKIGISQVDWGLADTGTLVQDSSDIEQRMVSTLPLIHIAIVGSANILPDMASLFLRINPREAPYIAFITGPSRTADIERVLTIGVHGPERLVIVCVDEQW